jgi:hypothetical protein
MTLRIADVDIRRDLDLSRLERLSEEAAEIADEEGALDGNQHYQDLSAASWEDVRDALEREATLIELFAGADNAADLESRFYGNCDPDDDRASLWNLDVGVAAAVLALNALGAHTCSSCNGGAFDGVHAADMPCVRFFPGDASAEVLVRLAKAAGAGLIEDEGRAVLYGRTVLDLQRFAVAALEMQSGADPNP